MSKLEAIKKDFKNFLFITWSHLNLPKPTRIQYEIADYLQDATESRKLIQAFRGCGKSWIAATYVLWLLLFERKHKCLIVSASKTRSDGFSTFCQNLIQDMPLLAPLKPDKDLHKYSKTAFDVGGCNIAQDPSVKSVGILGQLTGTRASLIIADDIEVTQNSITQDAREKLLKATGEFESILMPSSCNLNPSIVFLGTPQSEESIYRKLQERGYSTRIWPARFPSIESFNRYNGCLAPSLVKQIEDTPSCINKPTDEARFDEMDLIKREMSVGKSTFNLQFMLDTSLSDANKYPLKTSDLIILDLNTEKAPLSVAYGSSEQQQIKDDLNFPCIGFSGDRWFKPMFYESNYAAYEQAIMAIDPSGRGGDETAYAVVKQLQGKLYLLDAGGFKGGYDDACLLNLAKKAKEHAVNLILVESNFGDGMFSKVFNPVLLQHHRCNIEDVRHSTQKERRIIDTLEPVLNQHRLVVNADCVKRDLKLVRESESLTFSLFYQLTRITRDRGCLKHDDRLDAVAIAINYYADSMMLDERNALETYRKEQLEEMSRNFVESCNKVYGGSSNNMLESSYTYRIRVL